MTPSRPHPPRRLLAGLLPCVLLVAWVHPAAAHEVDLPIVPGGRVMAGPYLVEAWDHRAGLPQDTVTDLALGPDGFLWLTTFGGLARFDGETVRRFGGAVDDGQLAVRFTASAFAPDGALWLGVEHGGVVRWIDGRFERPPQPAELTAATVWSIDAAEAGVLVGSDAGLALLTADGWRTPRGPAGAERPVTAVAWGADGTAWLGAAGTVQSMAADGARVVVATVDERQPVLSLLPEGEGAWVAGGSRLGFATGRGVAWLTGVPRHQAWDLAFDGEGGLWAVGGRRVVRHPDRRAVRAALDAGAAPPDFEAWRLGERGARSVVVDRDGTVWIGTDGAGLMRLWRQPFDRLATAAGLADKDVRLLAADGSGGAWVVTGCRHLARVLGDVVQPVADDLPSTDCPRALAVDAAGALWVGVGDAARRLVEVDGRWSTVEVVPAGAPVRALAFDAEGALWIGTRGAGALRRGPGGRPSRAEGLQGDAVTSILPAPDGSVWLGHVGGVTRWSRDGAQVWGPAEGHPPGAVRALRLDADGALWIGTYGGGLGRLADGRIATLTRDAGLPDDVVSALLIDDEDVVWMNGNVGVFGAPRADLVAALERPDWRAPIVTYPTGEGNGIGQPSALRAPDGRLWFATMEGVARLDPAALRQGAPAPTPVFEAATLDGHALAVDGSSEVPPGPGELSVAFTVAALRRPELLRFEYRLAGGAWTPAGDRRVVRIHNLEPGRHRFEVRTVDGAGRPSDAVAGLAFRLRPAWHQVPALRLMLALALIAVGAALGATRITRLKRRARAMAAEIEQRKRAEVALVAEQEQRLALQAQLDHARRLEAIGRLAGGVAHDFNNLLTVTTSYTQLLQMDLEPEPGSDTAEFLDGIADCTRQAADLTAQLLSFGRRQHLERRALDLGEVVAALMPMLRRVVREDVALELDRPEGPLAVCVDRGQVEQAVVNLVANAAAAMPSGGTVSLGLGLTFPADAAQLWPDLSLEGTLVRLSVRDTGEGIPADVLPHIFEPFFTTRRAGVGTGLGLASVHGFVEQSGGQVRVHSALGEGTRFDVFLPCRGDTTLDGVVPTPPPALVDTTQVRGRVLLCDDAEAVRRSVAEVLQARGFEVVVAGSGEEALALLEGPAADVHGLVTDVVMPGMDGPALARAARERVPGLPVLFITGYADHHDLTAHSAAGPTAVVLKPFDGPRLVGALRALLVKADRRPTDDAHA